MFPKFQTNVVFSYHDVSCGAVDIILRFNIPKMAPIAPIENCVIFERFDQNEWTFL